VDAVVLAAVGALVYLAPSLAAAGRGLPPRLGLNLLLGWFAPVWLVLLVAALRQRPAASPTAPVVHVLPVVAPPAVPPYPPPWDRLPFPTQPFQDSRSLS
jgi:hypothetical protein